MKFILDALSDAISLLIKFDREVYEIIFFTIRTAAISTLVASVLGVPTGFIIAISHFRGKRAVVAVMNTLLAVPTVVVGLLLYSFICRQGPFGKFGLLFSPTAIILGQITLATPIVSAFTLAAIQTADPRIWLTARTLGAGKLRASLTVISELRFPVMASIIAGFGRIISEVGSAMMLGGNIKEYTRTLTTAIALETSKGEFGISMALGIILLFVAFTFNGFFQYLQGKAK